MNRQWSSKQPLDRKTITDRLTNVRRELASHANRQVVTEPEDQMENGCLFQCADAAATIIEPYGMIGTG